MLSVDGRLNAKFIVILDYVNIHNRLTNGHSYKRCDSNTVDIKRFSIDSNDGIFSNVVWSVKTDACGWC